MFGQQPLNRVAGRYPTQALTDSDDFLQPQLGGVTVEVQNREEKPIGVCSVTAVEQRLNQEISGIFVGLR